MAKSSSVPDSSKKPKIAERLAFDPFLDQQDLINEFIRNAINPDVDYGKTYYLGRVIDIIDKDDRFIDIRDVFYSASDNYERVTKAVSDKKYNLTRKVLLVHIPSFLTNARSSTGKKLNYETFTKIRVEYDGEIPVEIGYLVKIQFRDKSSFADPYVIGVEKMEKHYIDQIEPSIQAFKKYQECKQLNIDFPTDISIINVNATTRPFGGYTFAIKQLEAAFTQSYKQGFKKTLTSQEAKLFGDLTKLTIDIVKIELDREVYIEFGINDNFTSIIAPVTFEKDKHLITLKEVNFYTTNENEIQNLRNKFYEYIKLDFESRFGYSVFYEQNSPELKIDINSNLIFNKVAKTVSDYIEISKKFEAFNSVPVPSPSQTNTAASLQIAKPKEIADKCESDIASDKSVYHLVVDNDKPDKDAIREDLNVIISLGKYQNIITENFLRIDYFYKMLALANSSTLIKENNKFYKAEGQTLDKYNLDKKQVNFLNINDIDNRFDAIRLFLLRLKRQIEILEGFSTRPNDVMVLPITVLKIKKKVNPSGDLDVNSRHYYGKAVNFRVYLIERFEEQGGETYKAFQIPPEIIAMYCNLENVKGNQKFIGQGIFLETNRRYNHIEFLEDPSTMGLDEKDWIQRLMYTGDFDSLEKSLEAVTPGIARINKLKEIIRTGSNYISPVTKRLNPKFELLTS